MLTPVDLDLPPKFTEYRKGQFEISAKIAASTKYAYMLDAPTGIGKSLIAATIQRLSEKNMVYVSVTKQLQQQILDDFPYAKTLKGRGNYRCLKYPKMFPRITAEDCTAKDSSPCMHQDACPYLVAKKEALRAPLAVLNAAYFLSEANYSGGFSGTKLLLYDESDTIENMLMSFIEVQITQRQLDEIGIDPPRLKTKFESWIEWGKSVLKILVPRLEALNMQLDSAADSLWGTVDIDTMKRQRILDRLVKKITFFIEEVDDTWVWYQGEDTWIFKPTWIAPYAKRYLWSHAERSIQMSATILDYVQRAKDTGIDINDVAYSALPSPFPKENRPLFYRPVGKVINKEMDSVLPKLVTSINKILEKEHPEDKVLIHCVSYKILNYLKDRLPKNRIMTHGTSNRTEILETFKNSSLPKVLLSPSMDRGVDLPGEQCRAVIIPKMPYPDLGDPQIQRRLYGSKDGNRWYALQAVSKIIQMSGRGVRSPSDYADTYVLDAKFQELYEEWPMMFPKWWKEAIIWK